jgi:pimeloyl-ACP methyl ester carboxylesterase
MTGTVCCSYLAVCFSLYYSQRYLIFSPKETFSILPDAPRLGLSYQEVWIPVAKSSERLNAWWIEGKPTASRKDKVILYFLGRAGNKSSGVYRVEGMHEISLSVLAIDYRGFGNSDGSFPSEKQIYEDAEAAWQYLTKKRGILPQNIYIYGESLGGVVAIDLAVKHPEAGGAIVQSSFTSMEAIAKKHAKWLSWFPLDSIVTEKFDSLIKFCLTQTMSCQLDKNIF